MTEGHDKGNTKAATIDVQSERGRIVRQDEVVRCVCGHCSAETGTGDSRLISLYDAGARITIPCHVCHGPNGVGKSRIIKASIVPPLGGLNRPEGP